MNIDVLLILQSIRTNVLDAFMLAVTSLGQEQLLIIGVCMLYWCINKRLAQFIMLNFFLGGMVNACLKITFSVPRPWLLDSRVTPVAAAVHEATGFSFPSGHTASATAMYGSLAIYLRKRWLIWSCAAIIVLIGFSRMYLGVHTPSDVFTSWLLGAALLLVMSQLFPWLEKNSVPMLIIGLLLSFSLILYALTKPNEPLFYDAFKTGGAAIGLFVGWFLEARFVRFETRSSLGVHLARLIIGMILVGLVLATPWPFNLLDVRLGYVLRYSLMVLVALYGWPHLFSKLWRQHGNT